MKKAKWCSLALAALLPLLSVARPEITTKVTSKARARTGESESTDGYIIKRTDKGLIKIPRRQNFKFGGSDVEGSAQSPSQTVFGKRPTPQRASLIPERTSFRKELLDTAGSP